MRHAKKIFINKVPDDADLDSIKGLISSKQIKENLEHSYVYIMIHDDETVEVLAFKDGPVLKTAKEYNISKKQAVQMIYHSTEIDQAIRELQYWSNIGSYKKYLPVIAEANMKHGMEKVYAEFVVYAKDKVDAGIVMSDMDFEEYLYFEDVDSDE